MSTSRQDVPSSGWHVEIDGENGHTHTPDLLDDPQRVPKTNDLPEITIPVRRTEKWLDPQFERADMRVWCGGQRQPIDRLEKVEIQDGKTVLRGRGGVELLDPVEVQYDQDAIHEAARDLIEEHTPYAANVDAPNVDVEEDVQITSVTTKEDFINEFEIRDTDPIDIGNGYIGLHKSCAVSDAVDDSIANDGTTISSNVYSGGNAVELTSQGDRVVFQIDFPYRIPNEYVGVKIRDRTQGSSDISFRWNQTEFAHNSSDQVTISWHELGKSSLYSQGGGYQTVIGEDIDPDRSHFLGIVAEGSSSYIVDSIAVYDTRYNYTWDNYAGGTGQYLNGPEEYPDRVWVSSREIPLTKAVVGGRLDASLNSTTTTTDNSTPHIGFSQTQGRFYLTSNADENAESTGDWDNLDTPGGSLKVGFALSRWGDDADRQKIPAEGFRPHRVQDYQLTADLSTLPIIVNQSYNDSLRNVLKDLANRGDFVWEYRRDPKTGEQSIEWTQAGQRETEIDVDEVSYTVEKDSSQVADSVSVYGGSQSYIARFQADIGNSVGLPNTRIQELSDTVRNPRSGVRYERNEDYEIDYENGRITALSDGLMDDDGWYEVEYQYQTYGDYAVSGVQNPRQHPPQDIASLASNAACAQAARIIINDLQTPQFEAEMTIPQETIPWSLADALHVEGLETGGQALKIRNVEQRPGETVLTLGIGRNIGEIISDIETRVSSVSRNS
ncbi:hypothetical protein SAMN05421858_5052 [Haladaptatus litoreus]|uniref:Uncharacterized protein n=1 Tax=Haladaptatus litoreus TaxID=553468 RepID=A0A1N7FHA6_9EURY|nr:hypothetical protein [Haladaptatus litoreus]SIR99680.1 hypothetical protein SAMN05421858_5052 [Haladaptatus litoreus]